MLEVISVFVGFVVLASAYLYLENKNEEKEEMKKQIRKLEQEKAHAKLMAKRAERAAAIAREEEENRIRLEEARKRLDESANSLFKSFIAEVGAEATVGILKNSTKLAAEGMIQSKLKEV